MRIFFLVNLLISANLGDGEMTKKEQEYKMTGILSELYGENDYIYIAVKSNSVFNTIFNAIKSLGNNIEITIKEEK